LTAKAIDSESKISSLKAELRKNEAMLHGKANDIQKLKLTIDQLNFKIESLPDVSKLEAENVALKSRWQDLEVDMKAKLDEADAWLEETRNEKAGLENRIAEIVICDYADNRLAIAEAAIKRHTQEIDSLKTSISGINSKLAVLEHQKQAAVDLEVKVREYKNELFRLTEQISRWRYLQNACGKDGLRALEIDGTAPLISAYANDLLTATFGPGQTIGFRTQNEDGKEVLDIVAYRDGDAADGTLIDKLSGGERVWSLKALRLALTLVSKMKSSRNFQTAFSDEEDGALDAENAQSFINMYRAFMDAGGFESIIYITHRDECKALADHIIRLSGKGIEIESREMVRRAA
jgi:DNA repair exonuclease SbcCD ATPase subunit